MNIRTFDVASNSDYEALAQLRRAALPEYPHTVEEMHFLDRGFINSGKRWNRWFAIDENDQVIGSAIYGPSLWQPAPGKFIVYLMVHPDYHGRGIGKALYANLWNELSPQSPTYIKSEWREDMARAVRFFKERGFAEVARYYESRIVLTGFDFTPFTEDFDKPRAHGIVFHTLRELKASDPDVDHKIWRTSMELAVDVPSDVPHTELPFEEFQSIVMNKPGLDPDGFIVAVDERTGEYAGLSHIWRRQSDNDLDTGLTGVKRNYRRRGIAIAMKLMILRWAIQNGFHALRTENDVTNRPMLSINERLGFQKIPPWLELVWKPEN